MLSDVVVELLMDAFDDVRAAITVMIIGALPDIGINVLLDANVEAYVVVMTVDFAMPEPSEGFSSC